MESTIDSGSRVAVIIVAGGSGKRMGAAVPKQFLELSGRTVLELSLERFREALPGARIIVVLPEAEMPRWQEICRAGGIDGTHEAVAGGATRFQSVMRGLAAVGDAELVAVHDGVRPLASADLLRRCVAVAREHGSAVPVVRPVDSFRTVGAGGVSSVVDRSLLRAVQTPQVFRADWLRAAYAQPYDEAFTDDASVVEASGCGITLCEGERSNIKITVPEDLAVARALLSEMDRFR